MKRFVLALAALLVSQALYAQTPIIVGPSSQLQWDLPNTPLATAQGLTYTVSVQGSTTPIVLTNVTCAVNATVATTTSCGVAVNEIPSSGTITMTDTSGSVTSAPSASFTYLTVIIPVPASLRLKQ